MYNLYNEYMSNANNFDKRNLNDMQFSLLNKENPYFNYYIIKKGDNLFKISRQYNVNPDLLAQLNGLKKDDYIYENQQIVVPKEGVDIYITKEGDTLREVSKGMNAKLNLLLYQNPNLYLQSDQIIIYKEK